MQPSTQTLMPRRLFRAWMVIAIGVALGARVAHATPIYSTTGVVSSSVQCSGLGCAGLGVDHDNRAADNNLMGTYAVMSKNATAASSVSLRLGLSGTGHQGDRAGLLVALDGSAVSLSALGAYTIKTYLNGSATAQESHVVEVDGIQSLQVLAAASPPSQLEFVANRDFDAVELTISGAASLGYDLRVYYAYGVPALVPLPVQGLASQFSATNLAPYYSTAIAGGSGVAVCGNTTITNPQYAVDASLTNHATFGTFVSANCPSTLSVKLQDLKTAPAGYYAGFVLGNSGIVDLDVLSGLRLTTYKTINGVRTAQQSATGVGLLNLALLPDGKYQVSFPSTLPFDEVQIEQISGLSALSNLDIYYGFGLEPSAFQGTSRVLSDFSSTTAASKARASISGVCALCGVANPAGAADNNPATSATVVVTAGVTATVGLALDLNGQGRAGNRAGVIIQNNANNGLLDLALLNNLTLSTYDNNGKLLETASGSSLLSVNLLPDGKQEVSFRTTQDFSSVKISAASLLGVGVNIGVFQAFADDLASGLLPVIVPLPVELTAFAGQWLGGAAELKWTTASEKNSDYFVVERSTGRDDGFQPVGRVAAAGSSTRTLTYQFRDAEAGAQGAAILYYRLRQVDVDGTQAFSPLVAMAVGKQATAAPQLELYPNPAPDAQSVTAHFLNRPVSAGTLLVYSQMGQLVRQLPVVEAAQVLALPALAPGLYHVVLRDAQGQQLAAQRLVVGGR
ncbi:T9SS type A sorting domain-containing protein [Hymenobacter rubidus]|uniref:hypothetical protein n=1 Tax=Hymenobacter rubidus TaxID=1441626 RepID=UPI00191E1594|nr:hypothetical protein [Hymenobacter rubidus]